MNLWAFLAVVAVCLLVSSRGPVASLPPLGSPGLPPLGGLPVGGHPRARAAGVHPLVLAAIFVPWGLLAWSHFAPASKPSPDKPPAPAPDGWPTLDLRGAFVGETAAEDALTTQYLSDSLAAWVAYDGTLKEPRLKTGAAFADIRRIARDGRMEGLTLGGRQPLAKERIKAFLDAAVGDFGGPADPPLRAKFVRAMKDIAREAAAAVGRKS